MGPKHQIFESPGTIHKFYFDKDILVKEILFLKYGRGGGGVSKQNVRVWTLIQK